MTFGSSYREVRKNEGSRNRDSTVFQTSFCFSREFEIVAFNCIFNQKVLMT